MTDDCDDDASYEKEEAKENELETNRERPEKKLARQEIERRAMREQIQRKTHEKVS